MLLVFVEATGVMLSLVQQFRKPAKLKYFTSFISEKKNKQ